MKIKKILSLCIFRADESSPNLQFLPSRSLPHSFITILDQIETQEECSVLKEEMSSERSTVGPTHRTKRSKRKIKKQNLGEGATFMELFQGRRKTSDKYWATG